MTGTDWQRELSDQSAIQGLMDEYARSLDERDWGALSGCFTDDVVARLGMGSEPIHGRDAVVEACRAALTPFDATQHLLAPAQVELDGDTATLRCNVQATHLRQGSFLVVGGVYRDGATRTALGWRISEHELAAIWMRSS